MMKPTYYLLLILLLASLSAGLSSLLLQAKRELAETSQTYQATLLQLEDQAASTEAFYVQRLQASRRQLGQVTKPLTKVVTSVTYQVDTFWAQLVRDTVDTVSNSLSFSVSTRWYGLGGQFLRQEQALLFDSLVFRTQPTVVVGLRRRWFRPDVPTVTLSEENPFAQAAKITSQLVRPRPLRRLGLDLQAGVGVTGQPYLGLGLGLRLLNF